MAIDVGSWRWWQLLVAVLAWLLILPLIFGVGVMLAFFGQISAAGSGGIGAVSIGVSELLIEVYLLAPVVFVSWWAILKFRRRRQQAG